MALWVPKLGLPEQGRESDRVFSNLRSEVIGVENDWWRERRRGWGTEPRGTRTPGGQQREKGRETNRGGWEPPGDYFQEVINEKKQKE